MHSGGNIDILLQVYQVASNDYVSKGKAWGRDATPETMVKFLTVFFDNGKKIRKELIPLFIEKLKKIQEWIESQGDVRYYGNNVFDMLTFASGSTPARCSSCTMGWSRMARSQKSKFG